MKKSIYLIIGVVIVSIAGIAYSYSLPSNPIPSSSSQIMKDMDAPDMSSMMNQIPEDVIIKVHSSQTVYQGEKAEIGLQVLDKITNLPLENAGVLFGIEKGTSMTTMMMQGGMSKAKSTGDGHYLVSFTPSEKGVYTLHVHVIPEGKSMHSMMQNHMDIGLISK